MTFTVISAVAAVSNMMTSPDPALVQQGLEVGPDSADVVLSVFSFLFGVAFNGLLIGSAFHAQRRLQAQAMEDIASAPQALE